MKLNKRSADNLKVTDMGLPGVDQAREIVRWAYDDNTRLGNVKDFELDKKYVVAALRFIRDKGIPKYDDLKQQLKPLALRDKKAEILKKKIEDAKKSAASFDLLAAKMNCKIDSAKDLAFSAYSLPGTGHEQDVIGNIFSLKPGTMSQPIQGIKGVFVVKLINITDPPLPKDFRAEFYQQASMFRQRATYETYDALLKKADVKDNRIFYF